MKLTAPKRPIAIAAIWAGSLVVAASGTAFAAAKITGGQIVNGTVTSVDIKNGTIKPADLSPSAKKGLGAAAAGKAGKDGSNGSNGKDGKDVTLGGQFSADDVNIAKIGGSFTARATPAGNFTLGAGTYVVNAHVLFDRVNDAQASSPVLQLALRGPATAGNQWGADFGTAFTGEFPSTGNLEQTASTTRVVTLTESTVVSVKVFGYNADTSDNGSGNYTADVNVNAVKIG